MHSVDYNEIQRVAFTGTAALRMLRDNIQNTCDESGYFHWIAEFRVHINITYIQFAVRLNWFNLTVNCGCSRCGAVGLQACLQTMYIKGTFLFHIKTIYKEVSLYLYTFKMTAFNLSIPVPCPYSC